MGPWRLGHGHVWALLSAYHNSSCQCISCPALSCSAPGSKDQLPSLSPVTPNGVWPRGGTGPALTSLTMGLAVALCLSYGSCCFP